MRERDESRLQERAEELEGILGARPEIQVVRRISGRRPAGGRRDDGEPSLISVGSHGIAGLTRTRLGSVSTKVVTAAREAVLVCPHAE